MTLTTRKSHRTRALVIIALIVTFATMALLYVLNSDRHLPEASPVVQVTPPAKKTSTDATFGLPIRLQIPKLQVDANISYMGLTDGGEMDVPPDLINVGWYKYGAKPGEIGSAVIAGHLEGTEDLGVFTDLQKLQKGDTVSVRNDRNELIRFAVREARTYKQDERPTEIFNRTDGSYLNLITCSGIWDNAKQRYSHRYVVFADKIGR
ncbi:MAG: class F sortase [Candidatus Saccharimonadales bacterium]